MTEPYTVDLNLAFEFEVKEIFFDKDGLKARVAVSYMGAESMTLQKYELGADKTMLELLGTKSGGTTEEKTVKIGERVKIVG